MRVDLSGKTALVTGASRGIGEAIARRMAEAGAHVVAAARSLDRVQEIAKEIGGSALELDITAADVRERVRGVLADVASQACQGQRLFGVAATDDLQDRDHLRHARAAQA